MQNLNKLKFNLVRYSSMKEVEYLLTKNLDKNIRLDDCQNIFSEKFFNKNILLDFSLTIDGVEVFGFFNSKEIEERDYLVANKDLLDYVLLEECELFNFYNCSCGYPECGGFYGVPYIIFNNNGKTLIQMLLKKENGYGELIQKLKDSEVICNQNFEFETIIHSSNDGYSQIKECLQTLSENELILTFDYNDFLPLKNKVLDWEKQGKGVLTTDLLVENYVFWYAKSSKLNKLERSKLINNNLSKLAERISRLIKTFSFKEKVCKKLRKEVYLFVKAHNLKQDLAWRKLKESFVCFSIKDSIIDTSSFQYDSSMMKLLENYIFDKTQISLNIKYKGLKEVKRKILNNWIAIQKEINVLLKSFFELDILLEEDRNLKDFLKDFLTKEEVFDKQRLQKFLNKFNANVVSYQDIYGLGENLFQHVNYFTENFIKENGYMKKCCLPTYDELIHIFDDILPANSTLFSMLNKNTSVVRGNSLMKKYRIIHK